MSAYYDFVRNLGLPLGLFKNGCRIYVNANLNYHPWILKRASNPERSWCQYVLACPPARSNSVNADGHKRWQPGSNA